MFELAMLNEPSVFELLRFDCSLLAFSLDAIGRVCFCFIVARPGHLLYYLFYIFQNSIFISAIFYFF